MGFLQIIVVLIVVLLSILVIKLVDLVKIFRIPEKPIIEETWWSNGDPTKEDKGIYPFQINVSKDVLDDLQYRLEHTRPFTKPLVNDQSYGFNGDLAQEILHYWKTKYNWKKREKFLNKYPQFTTKVQGLKIHFLHVKPQNIPKNIKVLPLLILHGWPGSVREFYEIIPMLTTPQKNRNFVFEVIAPHLPGYVFSEAASKPGLGAIETGLIFKNLMNRLGFKKFYIQGGDLGSLIAQAMATNFEDSILGLHSNMCLSVHPYSLLKLFLASFYPNWIRNKNHQEFLYPMSKSLSFLLLEIGYLHLQATKPDSLGVSMDDSPMGLAVYYLEKFSTGTNFDNRFRPDGGLKQKFTYDDLLDNIMLYWINKCATTAFRLYSEIFNTRQFTTLAWLPVKIPTACARFKYDFVGPDGIISDIYHNLVQVNDYDGGHFAALENPKILANDIFNGVARMEIINERNASSPA